MAFARHGMGGELDLAWDPVNDPRVAVYQVQYGTVSGQYDQQIETTTNAATIDDLEDGLIYFFVVRACDAARALCSGFSNEVSKAFPNGNDRRSSKNGDDEDSSGDDDDRSSSKNGDDDSRTSGPGDGVQFMAYWPLDASRGTLATDQQNANDMMLNGSQWQPSSGQVGGALHFDGINDYAEASDASLHAEIPGSGWGDSTGDFTLAAWINPERLNDRQPILSKQGTTASGPTRGFVFSAGESDGSGKLYFEAFTDDTSGGKTSLTSTQALTVGQWQHVAVTYRYVADGSSIITLYIDGEEVGRTTTAVGPLQGNFQPLDLGRYYWSSSYQRYFKGLVDEVYVFADALSPTDIQDLASNEVSETPVNRAPEAVNDTATVAEDSTVNTLTVLGNDTDVDGNALTVSSASAAYGTVSINANGTLSYTPKANFHGIDTLTYEINDGAGGTDTATVTVSVTAVYERPVAGFSTNTTTGEAPLTVLFADTSTGEITTRDWAFGDGGTVADAGQAAYTYTVPGTYSVRLSVTGPGGTDEYVTDDLIVVLAPAPRGDGGSSGSGDDRSSSKNDGDDDSSGNDDDDSRTSGPDDDAQPAAYWPLDASSGTLVADQQNANDLNLNGPQWQPSLGQVDGALHFDGIDDYAQAGDASLHAEFPGSSWDNGTGDFTLAAWINPKRLNDRQPILSKQGTTAGGPKRGFMFSAGESNGSGKLYFEVFADESSGGKTSLRSTQALTVGQWQHVAVTYRYVADGSSVITLYVDGEEAGRTTTAVGPLQGNFQPLDLGRYYWSSSYQRYFQGLMDEVYVFGEALNPADIRDLVETGSDTDTDDTKVASDAEVVVIEVGEIALNHTWTRVDFRNEFDDPVVIVKLMSKIGDDPAVVRVDTVDSDGFWVRIQEWDYLNGKHLYETVSYMIVERGIHQLPNGTWIEADHVALKDGSFVTTDFTAQFVDKPVVLATVATYSENDAVTTRLRNVDQSGFQVRLQEQESNLQQHALEVVDYIAWEPSAGELDGLRFEVGRTGDAVDDTVHTIGYSTAFDRSPLFLANMQSTDGGDPANLRCDNVSSSAVDVWVDEERSRNSEVKHTTETVGYIALMSLGESGRR